MLSALRRASASADGSRQRTVSNAENRARNCAPSICWHLRRKKVGTTNLRGAFHRTTVCMDRRSCACNWRPRKHQLRAKRMKRAFIACLAITSWMLTVSAEAALYEVIPTSYERNVLNSSYIYIATIFDNTDGRVFMCSVTHTELSGKSLTYNCRDRSRDIHSVLTPSPDLTTTIQSSTWQAMLPTGGFWQINAKSGDLQFCLAVQGDSDLYRPVHGCIKLDWKAAKPF